MDVFCRYKTQGNNASRIRSNTFYLLCDLIQFFDLYHLNQMDDAFEVNLVLRIIRICKITIHTSIPYHRRHYHHHHYHPHHHCHPPSLSVPQPLVKPFFITVALLAQAKRVLFLKPVSPTFSITCLKQANLFVRSFMYSHVLYSETFVQNLNYLLN